MVSNDNRTIFIFLTLFLATVTVDTQKYYEPNVSPTSDAPIPDPTTLPLVPEDEQSEYVGPANDQGESESSSRSQGQDGNNLSNSEQDDDDDESSMSAEDMIDMPAPTFTSKRFFKLNDKFTIFNELLDKKLDPKGYPFPEIHGPAPWERVCVVGAGPAGIHMSLSLKKMGYKNVTIFEKTARVGGKAYDVNMVSGSYLPQGAFAFSSESFKTLVALAEEYGVGEYERIPDFGTWYTNFTLDGEDKLVSMDYLSMIMTMLTNGTDPGKSRFLLKKNAEKNAEILISAVANYSRAHQALFGKYEGELMHPPEPYLLYHNLSGTFNDFLKRENLTILVPFFELLHTGHGYGYLDEVGAIYGLMRNTPELVISAALRLLEADSDPYSFYAFKEGFENIWKTIVEKEKLDIVYNSNIVNIARSPLGTYIHHTMGDGLHITIDWCDFLIWTPPMTEMLKKLSTAATHEEHHYFGNLHPEIYSVSLMSSNSPFKGESEAYTYYRDNIVDKTNHGVICDLSVSNVFDENNSNRIKRSFDNFAEEKGINRVKRNWDNFAKLKKRGRNRQGKKQNEKGNLKKKLSSSKKSKNNGEWEASSKIKDNGRNRSGGKSNGRNRKEKSKNTGEWETSSKIKENSRNKSGGKRNGRNRKQNKKQNILQNGFGRINSIQDIINQDDWNPPQNNRGQKPRQGKKNQFRQSNPRKNLVTTFQKSKTSIRSQTRNGRKNSFGRNSKARQGRQNRGGRGGAEGQDFKVIYQIGKNYTSESHLNNMAKEYFVEGFEHEDVEIFNTIQWPYFHRWTAHEVMKGNHWDVFSLQGVYRTWYAGSSVSFESVKSVLEYNNLLLRQMKDPYEKLPIKHGEHPPPHHLPYVDHSHPLGHHKIPLRAEYPIDHHPKLHHPIEHHPKLHHPIDHHPKLHHSIDHHPNLHHPIDHRLVDHAKHLLHADIQHPIHPHTPVPVDHVLPHHLPPTPHPDPHVPLSVQHWPQTPAPVPHHGPVAHHPHPHPSIGPHLPPHNPHRPHVPQPHHPHPTPHLDHHLSHQLPPRPTQYESSHDYYPHQIG